MTSERIWPGWSRLMHGTFMLGRYKSGLSGFVAGSRGDWAWYVDRRLSPTFKGEKITEGTASTRRAAQLAAQDAIRAAEAGDSFSAANREFQKGRRLAAAQAAAAEAGV